jgi:hypothetical protein
LSNSGASSRLPLACRRSAFASRGEIGSGRYVIDRFFLRFLHGSYDVMTSNVIAAFAAIVSFATALILVWQTRSIVKNQAILQLLAFWQSEPMYPRIRGGAASTTRSILDNKREGRVSHINMAHVDDVLDFFETVAFLTKRKSIDFETTHHTFFWPMASYWVIHKDYFLLEQGKAAAAWCEYSNLMQQLLAKEKEPSHEDARDFFGDELFRSQLDRGRNLQ